MDELRRLPIAVAGCQEPATAVAGHRNSSPELNRTRLNDPVQFSSVQFLPRDATFSNFLIRVIFEGTPPWGFSHKVKIHIFLRCEQ